MDLTDTKIKGLKPSSKVFRMNDGRGLCLEVRPSGAKYFKFRYKKHDGKFSMISLGRYPELSLKDARDLAQKKRSMLAKGMDISRESGNTFKEIFEEWHSKNLNKWDAEYAQTIKSRVENNILPWIGYKHVNDVTPLDLSGALRKVEDRGAVETAHRILQYLKQIFSYAISNSLCERNPAMDVKGSLAPSVKKSYPAPTDLQQIRVVLQAIDKYPGSFITVCALKMLTLTMLRPGELRKGLWTEIDLDQQEWIIPSSRMKVKKNSRVQGRLDHIVPLSSQAIDVLKELHPLTSVSEYIFPAEYTKHRPMSENTMNVALRRMGFTQDEIVSHSFRSTASTLLNESGWPADWIEKQLHHIKGDVRGIYNRAEYLEQRKKMLQAWADFLDYLREGGTDINKLKAGQNNALDSR